MELPPRVASIFEIVPFPRPMRRLRSLTVAPPESATWSAHASATEFVS